MIPPAPVIKSTSKKKKKKKSLSDEVQGMFFYNYKPENIKRKEISVMCFVSCSKKTIRLRDTFLLCKVFPEILIGSLT